MSIKLKVLQTIFTVLLLNRCINCQPITSEEEEEHVTNRLRHYLKRIELIAQKPDAKFISELQNLMDKYKHSIKKASFKEKSQLLDSEIKNLELYEYLADEFDKQYINEDILIESWYLNEISPHVSKDLYDELTSVIHDLKEAYHNEDLETKFNIYTDVGENLSDQFLDYFFGEHAPEPLLNAQLKYYREYLDYLLKECQVGGVFEKQIQELAEKVDMARASGNRDEKDNVIDLFDNLDTKFGRYLDENFVDFRMYKFGE